MRRRPAARVPNGALRFGTYLGGARDDQITSISLDRTARNGNGLLAFGGFSNSVEFLRSAGYDDFVGLIDYESLESISGGAGYRLERFGGVGNDSINGVAVPGDLIYAVGGTRSTRSSRPAPRSASRTPSSSTRGTAARPGRSASTRRRRRSRSSTTSSSTPTDPRTRRSPASSPGGNYGGCTFGTCLPVGFVKLAGATFEPGPVVTLVPPAGHRYAVQDLDGRRVANGTIDALGAAVDSYDSFALSATPTGVATVLKPGPTVASTTELPKGTLAWGTAVAGDSLFVAGVALEETFDGIHGEADGFVSKLTDLGLDTCACSAVATTARAMRTTKKSVAFTVDWAMTCTGGSGQCEGELAVAAPRGVRVSQPAQRIHCGPGECTSTPQRGSFRVTAAVTPGRRAGSPSPCRSGASAATRAPRWRRRGSPSRCLRSSGVELRKRAASPGSAFTSRSAGS